MKPIANLLSALAILTTVITLRADEEGDRLFRADEFDISPYVAYSDQSGGKWGAGAAFTYFFTENIGAGASTYWTEFQGTVFDNLEGEAYLRLPLFKAVAPYAVGGLGYQFDRHYWFETIGGGVDFRAFKSLDLFSDIQYRIANSGNSPNGVFIRAGVRISL